ncbi:MAG TPA: vitamin K epoxide reductase family protein [Candidatus Saccharimonadales bacterium]
MNKRAIYGVMSGGGAVGLAAAFLQMLEKIQLLKNADKALVCDLNSVFSCSSVLSAWQSSVFGFPNSLMCIVFFSAFTVAALAGLSGASLPRSFRISIHAMSLLVLGFALWFLWQSIYAIGSLCILCIFCLAGLLLVNWAWLRINANDLPIGRRGQAALARLIKSDLDTFSWVLLGAVIAFAMLLRFL